MKTLSPLLLVALLATLSIGTGCSSSMSSADLRSNWTPELYSLTMSREAYRNSTTRIYDNNFRQVPDDIARIFLVDRNLRLTNYVLP